MARASRTRAALVALAVAGLASAAHPLRGAAKGVSSSSSSSSPSSSLVASDDPYEELISRRLPFANTFAPSAVPTGWDQLVCSNATSPAIAPVSNTTAGGSASVPRSVLLCSGGGPNPSILDVRSNTVYALQGVPLTGGPWMFAQPVSGEVFTSSSPNWLPPLLAVGPSSVVSLTCALAASGNSAGICTAATVVAAHNITEVATAGVYPSVTSEGGWTLWVGGHNGTRAWDVSFPSLSTQLLLTSDGYTAAVAFSPASNVVAIGNSSMLIYLSAADPSGPWLRWEWVTLVSVGSGGPIDDIITSLAFDDAAVTPGQNGPILYIGNPSCLNVAILPPIGTDPFVAPVIYRVGGPEGLPYGNITSAVIDLSSPPGRNPGSPRRLFLGTDAGVILFDPAATMEYGASSSPSADGSSLSVPFAQRWRYLAGGRWLPVSASQPLVSTVQPFGIVAHPFDSPVAPPFPSGPLGGLLVLTVQGVAWIESRAYTLAAKAAEFEAALPSFILGKTTGIIAQCPLPSFGVTATCTPQPDENNGLWTSLLVGAFSAKYTVTNDPADAALANSYLGGLYILNNVTGVQGLFARSAVPPGFPPPEGSVLETDKGKLEGASSPSVGCCPWRNSTSMPGWVWEGDTSSDEVAGHTMAYTVGLSWLPAGGPEAAAAAATILHLTRYVVGNNFTLVDVTGQPTSWGHWDPATINNVRYWSDERGLNPVEMFAMLTGALAAVNVPGSGGGSNDTTAFLEAMQYLLTPEVDYGNSMVNAKIIVPDDDNYSDDELLYFSYFPLLLATEGPVGQTAPGAAVRSFALQSLARTWPLIAFTRPSLWNVISLAMLGANASGYANAPASSASVTAKGSIASLFAPSSSSSSFSSSSSTYSTPGLPLPDPTAAVSDALWNLRTWPLEFVDWPTQNSIRLDVLPDPEVDRDFHSNTQSLLILPGNERDFNRWNGNPRTLDDGSGGSATDPGAYLMPYWLLRRYGYLAAA
jgi:hypothetical protein